MSRSGIYYWKCDRPAAFHGTQAVHHEACPIIEPRLREALCHHFKTAAVKLQPRMSQGNHLTWNAQVSGRAMFIRVENGPERDGHLAVESALMDKVRSTGVPTPQVFGFDATRTKVPFAWQAIEHVEAPDLNELYKHGSLDIPNIAFQLGVAVAKWQQLTFPGFGPFDGDLRGFHGRYPDYFHLRLEHHIQFLVQTGFLTAAVSDDILRAIKDHHALLALGSGCFVHKDLALWNVLGSARAITAFIDFDDAISGDPMDDASLLACFHDAAFLRQVFDGYQTLRPLPGEYLRRFWLHLLRNMIVKAVIRIGGGYFQRNKNFFLLGAGVTGSDLREFTQKRLQCALTGLSRNESLDIL